MKKTKTKLNRKPRADSLQRRVRGHGKDALKEAWMAGAHAGTETAFQLILGTLENMGKEMGLKSRKPQNHEHPELSALVHKWRASASGNIRRGRGFKAKDRHKAIQALAMAGGLRICASDLEAALGMSPPPNNEVSGGMDASAPAKGSAVPENL